MFNNLFFNKNDGCHFCARFFLYICPRCLTYGNKQMLIRFCAYILFAALTLHTFYRSIMNVEYQIHLPAYIAQCINKDKPHLNCHGQYALMKKLEDNTEKKRSEESEEGKEW